MAIRRIHAAIAAIAMATATLALAGNPAAAGQKDQAAYPQRAPAASVSNSRVAGRVGPARVEKYGQAFLGLLQDPETDVLPLLRRAVETDFVSQMQLDDALFDPLRDDPGFQSIVADLERRRSDL